MRLRTGIVILNYNDYENTKALVESIYHYDAIDLICVVDNCSVDASYERLLDLQDDRCSIIRNTENRGYAAGNNLGCRYLIEQHGVDILMIANPDVRIEEQTVTKIKRNFEEHSEYVILSALMYNPDGTIAERPYIRIPSFYQDMMLCFYSYNRYDEKKHPYILNKSSNIMQVDAVQGSFWAIRATVLAEIGYMDEGTFLFYEEMCIAMRIRKSYPWGKIGLLTDAGYVHYHSVSIHNNLSVMKTYKTYMASKDYFERTYNGIKGIRYMALKVAITISCVEEWLLIHLIKRRNK